MSLDNLEEQRKEIIEQLQTLNDAIATQNSIRHKFLTGLIYGMGFVIGSAILATIAIGVLMPVLGQIPWIRESFTSGTHLLGK